VAVPAAEAAMRWLSSRAVSLVQRPLVVPVQRIRRATTAA
jgi:hypothetical protein